MKKARPRISHELNAWIQANLPGASVAEKLDKAFAPLMNGGLEAHGGDVGQAIQRAIAGDEGVVGDDDDTAAIAAATEYYGDLETAVRESLLRVGRERIAKLRSMESRREDLSSYSLWELEELDPKKSPGVVEERIKRAIMVLVNHNNQQPDNTTRIRIAPRLLDNLRRELVALYPDVFASAFSYKAIKPILDNEEFIHCPDGVDRHADGYNEFMGFSIQHNRSANGLDRAIEAFERMLGSTEI